MYRVMIIHSNGPYNDWFDYETCPPISIGFIAGKLASLENVDFIILDANIEKFNINQIIDKIKDFGPSLIGISFLTPQADFAFSLTMSIKNDYKLKSIILVHGGVHPQLYPKECFEHGADYCSVGDGVTGFIELIKNKLGFSITKGLLGLIDKTQVNKYNAFSNILMYQGLDIPHWEYFPLSKYSLTLEVTDDKALPMISSLGCPNNCDFCSIPRICNRKIIFRNSNIILNEIKRNIRLFNIPNIHFYDDDFLLSEEHVKSICNGIIEEKLDVKFICEASVKSILRNKHLIKLMKKAGCIGIEIGIESGADNVLTEIKKKQSYDDIQRAVDIVHKNKLKIATYLIMCCLPGETIKSHRMSNEFLCNLTKTGKIFIGHYVTPYPGSNLYDTVNRKGRLLVSQWKDFLPSNITFIPNSLLNEIPIKNIPYLSNGDIMIIFTYNWRGTVNIFDKIADKLKFISHIRDMYLLIDGKLTNDGLINKLYRRHGGEYIYWARLVIKNIIIMSQCGLIRSNEMTSTTAHDLSHWYKEARKQPRKWLKDNKHHLYYYKDN